MTTEDTPTASLHAIIRCAIAATCRRYECPCAAIVATSANTPARWLAVLDTISVESPRDSRPPALHSAAVAARLMAEGDEETAARELAAVRGQTVEVWREEHTRVA